MVLKKMMKLMDRCPMNWPAVAFATRRLALCSASSSSSRPSLIASIRSKQKKKDKAF